MAQNYFHNAHQYPVEVATAAGSTISVAFGKYVKGSDGGPFARATTLGVLTNDGAGTPAAVTADPALLIFQEVVPPGLGPQGDSGTSGDTGTTGGVGAAGDTGVAGDKGDTGTAGAKGDTGAAGT